MKDVKQLLEELEAVMNNVQEDTLQDVAPEGKAELQEPKTEIKDEITVADKLAIKTKIARSLEFLKDAVTDFKDAAIEKINMLDDACLLGAIEALDAQLETIEKCLSQEVADTPLNNVFNAPAKAGEEPESAEENTEVAEEEEITPVVDLSDFDSVASMNLLGGE